MMKIKKHNIFKNLNLNFNKLYLIIFLFTLNFFSMDFVSMEFAMGSETLSHVKNGKKKSKSSDRTTKKSIGGSHLQTDVQFSGHEINGKYQVPGEATAVVEKEKPLLDLIEPRRDFKDRLNQQMRQR